MVYVKKIEISGAESDIFNHVTNSNYAEGKWNRQRKFKKMWKVKSAKEIINSSGSETDGLSPWHPIKLIGYRIAKNKNPKYKKNQFKPFATVEQFAHEWIGNYAGFKS